MSALTIVSSEFGTFLNPNDREMVDVLVSLWDGQKGAWKKATKTMGDDVIVNPWVNILACTTPSWIAGNFPEYMIGGGFTSRCIFVYAEHKRQLIAYPGEHVGNDFKEIEANLVHDLELISQLKGAYSLSPDARTYGVNWYEEHYANRPKHLSDKQFGGYVARKQTHIHKLAMVLEASRSDSLVVQQETLESANAMVTSLEFDMPKVFQQIGANDAGRVTGLVHELLSNQKKMTRGAIHRQFVGKCAHTEIDTAISGLLTAGYARQIQSGPETFLVYTGDVLNAKGEHEDGSKAVRIISGV